MSRASTLALAAAGTIGANGTASAAPCAFTYTTSSINEVYISNATDCVLITSTTVAAGALGNSFTNIPLNVIGLVAETVGVDITAGSSLVGKFLNSGTIYGSATGVQVSNSSLLAGFVNNGLIDGTSGDGVVIEASNVTGGFTNTGRILGNGSSGIGLLISNTTLATGHTFAGGLTNSGTIQGNDTGIYIGGEGNQIFSGGLTNSGRILGGSNEAIEIGDTVTFTGGITNTSTGHIISESSTGIRIEADTFAGGIHNQGTIAGATTSGTGHGIHLTSAVTNFTGGITNSGLIEGNGGEAGDGINVEADVFGIPDVAGQGIHNTGTISGNEDGIDIESDVTTFNGGITNAGRILAASSQGIETDAITFNGGINNSGTILADDEGIEVEGTTFNGGIVNSGLIDSATSDGISIDLPTFNGGINNSGTIEADDDGIKVEGDNGLNTFNNGITNSGLIRSLNEDGIDIEADDFFGGLTNSGTIIADRSGIEIGEGDNEIFTGGLTNSGTILSGSTGIDIDVDDFNGGVTSSGLIDASTSRGINIDALTFDGGVHNSGRILGSSGIHIEVVSTFDGGVHNSGTIIASSGTGIWIDPITFNGGVTNTGTIIASGGEGDGDGIHVESTTTFNDGFLNSGLIDASGGGEAGGTGVFFDVTTFNGGFVNSGTILADPDNNPSAGVVILAETFNGGLTNSGLIDVDSGMGVYFSGKTFHNGIVNSGTIFATDPGTGIRVFANAFDGGFLNSGLIDVTSGTGARFTITGNFAGGVTNTGTILADDDAIHMDVLQTFSGGITNSGSLIAGDDGIRVEGDVFNGGIHNLAGGFIDAGETGIQTDNDTFAGGIHNAGIINADSRGIDVDLSGVAIFSGGITNTGKIIVDDTAVEIDATTFTGGFVNSGTIQGNDGTGVHIDVTTFSNGFLNSGTITATSDGVDLNGTTFNGGFTNSGLIGASSTGVEIDTTTFNGGFTNSGTIDASSDGVNFGGTTFSGGFTNTGIIASDSTAVYIGGTAFSGGFTNSGDISGNTSGVRVSNTTFSGGFTNSGLISAGSYGVDIDTTTWSSGNFTNSGTIESVTYTALAIDATTFTGNIVNSGTIKSADYTAVSINIDTINGGFTNSGLIQGESSGVYMASTAMTGNFINSGSIITNTESAIYLSSTTIGGYFSNSGLIQSNTEDGIDVNSGHISGGIFNSGTIWVDDDAIELSDADTGHVITQTAGIIHGDIRINNGYEDVVNLNGGLLDGDIVGSSDTINVDASGAAAQGTAGTDDEVAAGTFAYLRGSVDDVDYFNVNGGTAVMGSNLVGKNFSHTGTQTHSLNEDLNVNSGGTLYLDDDTEFDVSDDYTQQSGGDVQFLLSRDTDDNEFAGTIFASSANVDGTITGVVDLAAFALGGSETEFFYDDVIDSDDLNGTFDTVRVLNNLIFFNIEADYSDGGENVDLYLTRLGFADVLAPASQSDNQQAVGGVLETIFDNGASPEFADAFEALLGATTYEEALAVYDKLLGAEHAQTSLASLNAMYQFQTIMGERMDVLHNGMGSAQWALFGQPSDQLAMAETVMADASPSPSMGGVNLYTTRDANTLSMWGGVHGNWTTVEGDTNGPGFDQDTFGISGGVDYASSSEALIGFGGSYMNSDLEFDSLNSGDVDTFALGLYGAFGLGGGYLDANANVAFHDVSSSRVTPALLPAETASANYDATSWSLSGEIGTVIPVGRAYVAPMLSLTYTGLSVDGFEETGSPGFNLIVASADTDSFATVLGARAGDYFKVGNAIVNLQGNLGWRHEFGDDVASFSGAFQEDPSLLFNVNGSQIAEDSATFGVGSTVSLSTRFEVFLNYDGIWNADAQGHNANLGLRANW